MIIFMVINQVTSVVNQMDLPDCPPGAEGYQDSVYEAPKKPIDNQDETCTKVNIIFQYKFKK